MPSFHELSADKLKEALYNSLRASVSAFLNEYKREHSIIPSALDLIEHNILNKEQHILMLKNTLLNQQYNYEQSSQMAQNHFLFYLAQEQFYQAVKNNDASQIYQLITHKVTPADVTYDGYWAIRRCCLHGFTEAYQSILEHHPPHFDIHFENDMAIKMCVGYNQPTMVFLTINHLLKNNPKNITIFETIFKELKSPQYQIMIERLTLFGHLSKSISNHDFIDNETDIRHSPIIKI
jgi:hypothetical protein